MADYTTITDAQVDPEAPITSELMSALRDNPIAIAEAATGAPRISGSALDSALTPTLSNTVGPTFGSSAVVVATVTGLDDAEVLFMAGIVTATYSTGPGTSTLRADISSDNGSTWPYSIEVVSVTDTNVGGSETNLGGAVIPMTGFNACRLVHVYNQNGGVSTVSNAILTSSGF